MNLLSKVWGSPIPTLLFSFLALTFAIVSFMGCDFVRLRFGPINDNSFIFPNDEWFGLGLFRHQDFATGKTASTWDHSSSCYDYSELDAEMFRSTNVKTAGSLFIAAWVLSAATLVVLLVMKYRAVQTKSWVILTAVLSVLSAVLQIVVLTTMLDNEGRSVCSVGRYSTDMNGTWSWYVDYPSALFPYLAYVRFFQSCELGSTGKIAIAGVVMQFIAAVSCVLEYCFASDKEKLSNFSIPIVSEVPRDDSVRAKKVMDDEEAQDGTIEGSYENNQSGPVATSAPGYVMEEKFNDDNISYVNDIEDEIKAEDDLSLDAAVDEPYVAEDSAAPTPSTSVEHEIPAPPPTVLDSETMKKPTSAAAIENLVPSPAVESETQASSPADDDVQVLEPEKQKSTEKAAEPSTDSGTLTGVSSPTPVLGTKTLESGTF